MALFIDNVLLRQLAAILALGCSVAGGQSVVTLTFRDSAVVRDTAIRLADIAGISGGRDSLAGLWVAQSAPPGSTRYVSAADVVAYRLNQSSKDVTFRYVADKRIKVATIGIAKRLADCDSLLRVCLCRQTGWKGNQLSIVIENPDETWKQWDAPAEPLKVSIEGLRSSWPRGRLRLRFVSEQYNRKTIIPLLCRITAKSRVVVAAADLAQRKIIVPSDLAVREMELTENGPDPCFAPAEVAGRRTINPVRCGALLNSRMFEAPPLVERGDALRIVIDRPGVRISVNGIARENGLLGDKILVENTMTHKLVRALVKGRAVVTVSEGRS